MVQGSCERDKKAKGEAERGLQAGKRHGTDQDIRRVHRGLGASRTS
jgi:hypothetical protein